jgi:hypothetical protein
MESDLTYCRWVYMQNPKSECGPLRWIARLDDKWEYAYCDKHIKGVRAHYGSVVVRPNPAVGPMAPEQTLAEWRRQHVGVE